MEPANGTEGPQPEGPSQAVQIIKRIWGFCLDNWLIFAFAFATLMAYLFPREYTAAPAPHYSGRYANQLKMWQQKGV